MAEAVNVPYYYHTHFLHISKTVHIHATKFPFGNRENFEPRFPMQGVYNIFQGNVQAQHRIRPASLQ
jgi:hypothetical protein